MTKKADELVGSTTIINRAITQVSGFEDLLHRFKRSISVLRRSELTFKSYARNIAAMALRFGKTPTELDVEQVQEYLFSLQKQAKMPSQTTYFKHTVLLQKKEDN